MFQTWESATSRIDFGVVKWALTPTFRDWLLPLIALGAIAVLPLTATYTVMVIGGHAHFLMASLYQYRAGKITMRYIVTAIFLLAAALAYFYFSGAFFPLYFAASLIFGVHFAIDEVALHGERWTKANIATVCGFVLFFSSTILLIVPAFAYLAPIIAAGVAAAIGIRIVASPRTTSKTERYLWFIMAALFLYSIFVPAFMLPTVTTFIIWLHYLNWMLGYGAKVAEGPRASRYWFDTVVTSGGSLFLWLVFALVPVPWLGVLFKYSPFHAWAIGHIVLSSPLIVGARKGYR